MMKDNILARTIIKIISPFTILYGLYILINGEDSPGGGFQAGAILATNLIMLDFIGFINYNEFFIRILIILSALGVLIYALVGFISILQGANFLNYYILSENRLVGQYYGIFIIELGIAITVSSVLSLIYFSFKITK